MDETLVVITQSCLSPVARSYYVAPLKKVSEGDAELKERTQSSTKTDAVWKEQDQHAPLLLHIRVVKLLPVSQVVSGSVDCKLPGRSRSIFTETMGWCMPEAVSLQCRSLAAGVGSVRATVERL
jgi:hypothetical protein